MLTDDLKISINQIIRGFEEKEKNIFYNAIKYIFKKIEYSQYDEFCEYLYTKLDLLKSDRTLRLKNRINRLEEELQQTKLLLGQKMVNESLKQMRAEYQERIK